MMPDYIRAELERGDTELHRHWVEYARRRKDAACRRWSERHAGWREAEQLDAAFRVPDDDDQRTRSRGLTRGVQKIVVPYAYAQVRALLAFFMSVFTQRTPIIPVGGMGPGDVRAAILHELLLDYQGGQMETKYILLLYQWLYDAARYGIGVVKNGWTIREWPDLVRKVTPILDPFTGQPTSYDDQLEDRDVIAYEGNESHNVSPFNFLPDPNLPMGQFQQGEFVCEEYRSSWSRMETLAAEGLRAGLEFVPKIPPQGKDYGHGTSSDLPRITNMSDTDIWPTDEFQHPYVQNFDLLAFVHPEQLKLPERLEMRDEDGVPATRWKAPRLFIMTLTNDQRITRLEPANLPGRRYPYEVIELNYDVHAPANVSLVEVTAGLNYVYTWLFNSRMQSVRRTNNNQLVIDPSMVEENDLLADDPGLLIRLKRQHWQAGATKEAVYPIPFQDVTQSHLSLDAPVTRDLMDTVLGIPPPMMGLANRGRRSATEVQGQLTAATGRGKMLLELASQQGIIPHAMGMVRNNQAFLDGQTLALREPYATLFGQPMLTVTPEMLQGEFSIPIGELGIPTDKNMEAGFWRDVFMQMVQAGVLNPQMIPPQFIQVVMSRMLWAMGIRDIQSAGLTMANLSVVPSEQVQNQVQQGNLAPIQGTGAPMGGGGPMGNGGGGSLMSGGPPTQSSDGFPQNSNNGYG